MRASGVVEAKILADAGAGRGRCVVGAQVDLLVLNRASQPLDKHVVQPAALAFHTDRNSCGLEHVSEGRAGELAALIGVEDRGRPTGASASSSAVTQQSAVIVFDRRQASTFRLYQSITATR